MAWSTGICGMVVALFGVAVIVTAVYGNSKMLAVGVLLVVIGLLGGYFGVGSGLALRRRDGKP